MGRIIGGALLVTASVSPFAASESAKLTIRVSPRVAHAPGRIVVRTTIERHVANRAIQVVAESIEYYRSSTVHLDGDQAARTTVVQFRGLPLGEYRVSATLLGTGDAILASVYRDVIVSEPRQVIPTR
jgi:hypothetical protein